MLPATDFASIRQRFQALAPTSQPLWGKMNVAQMVQHCQRPLEVAVGDRTLKTGILSFLFGKVAKRSLLKSDQFSKNLPTAPEFKISGDVPFETERERLVSLIDRFLSLKAAELESNKHPFFGYMNEAEWKDVMYKHLDHHLRQFGA